MRPRQIVALGGGGFASEPDNPLLDAYILSLVANPKPRVCFFPTASGDAERHIHRFHRAFKKRAGKQTSHVTLAPPNRDNLAAHLLAQDIIYVGGGSTKLLLDLWRQHGVDDILREAYARGIVLAGVSAGASCWFTACLTDAVPGTLSALPALGFLPGSISAHYDTEPARRSAFHKFIASGALPPGYGVADGVALHFVDEVLARTVTSRPDARAYTVARVAQHSRETELVPIYLGGKETLIRRAAHRDIDGIHSAHQRSVRELAAKDYNPQEIDAWCGASPEEAGMVIGSQLDVDCFWVLEIAGQIEGYIHLRDRAGEHLSRTAPAYINALYLTSAAAGHGYGKRLIALLETEVMRRGQTRIELHASTTALGFYAAVGYSRSGPPMLHLVRGIGLNCFPMFKELKSSSN